MRGLFIAVLTGITNKHLTASENMNNSNNNSLYIKTPVNQFGSDRKLLILGLETVF